MATVRHSASRNASDESTPVHVDQPRPLSPTFSDSRHTRMSGYTAASRTIANGGTAHHAANDRGGAGRSGASDAGFSSSAVTTPALGSTRRGSSRPGPARLPGRET